MQFKSTQNGFSLIELMISLTLGLLISAAVMQVYLTSVRTSSMQSGGTDILEASIFGIQGIEKSIRLTNLGMADINNPFTPMAGVVVSSDTSLVGSDPSKNNMNGIKMGGTETSAGTTDIAAKYLTKSGVQASNISGLKSSQLTIQYEAPQDMYDCEGSFVRGPKEINRSGNLETIPGQVIIERYFLNEVTQKSDYESDINSYELRCDAGRYIRENLTPAELTAQAISGKDTTKLGATKSIRDFGDIGKVIIPRVDYFGVLLGVQIIDDSGSTIPVLQYFTPEQYIVFLKETATDSPSITTDIISIKLSALVRASRPLVGETGSSNFEIFGAEKSLSLDTTSKAFIRRVYESNITLRNSRAIKD